VAEEVAELDPNLAARDGKGQFQGVRYTAINAMLLNEFLKEHKKAQESESRMAQQEKQIESLTAALQKVSAQIEISRPAPEVAANNQ
jgi:hypothetical protein